MNPQAIGAIDLFCGCGGASLGLKEAGYRILGAVDIDPIACVTYSEIVGLEPICGDLNVVDGPTILEHYGLSRGDVDLIVGCPPCQGFSSLRQTTAPFGEDDRNGLIGVFVERVREIRPRVVIFENVPGITWIEAGQHLNFYLEAMRKLDYYTEWDVFDAADYGVPQRRKRVVAFSVLDLPKGKELLLPESIHANPRIAEAEGKPSWKTVRDAISDLPPLKAGESDPSIPNHEAKNHSLKVMEIIRNVPKDGGSRKDLPSHLWLKCHKNLEKGAESVYGRMAWDRPGPTMTCRCTTPSSGRFIHPEQDRAITPREAARIQTFSDECTFPESFAQSERLIGNAVAVTFMRQLSTQFFNQNEFLF